MHYKNTDSFWHIKHQDSLEHYWEMWFGVGENECLSFLKITDMMLPIFYNEIPGLISCPYPSPISPRYSFNIDNSPRVLNLTGTPDVPTPQLVTPCKLRYRQ